MLNKQLVLTSDKPPVELQGMEERLYPFEVGIDSRIKSSGFGFTKENPEK